jgi:hypothetical protein
VSGSRIKFDAAAVGRVRTAAAEGLRDAAIHVKKKSQEIVPVDQGEDLKLSAQVQVDEAALRATVSYGSRGLSRAYAVHQHEDLALHHDPGKSAKFLEKPLHAEAAKVLGIIADRIRRSMK